LELAVTGKTDIIFDFDLTIAKMDIDWSGWHTGIAEVYADFDRDHGYARGASPFGFYNAMAAKYGDRLIEAVRAFNAEYERIHTKGFIPSNQLVTLIHSIPDKRLYIFSSNSRNTVEKGLIQLQLRTNFRQIISRDEVRFLKPDPEGFGLIEGFERRKDSFLMVGDSSSDEQAARSAGIDFFKYDEFETYRF
jgi:phosphoglycolate phosphatase-like HAD superfamily hydrolase